MNEVVPRVAAVKIGVSEADLLGLLTVFEDTQIVKHRYDLICRETDEIIISRYDLKEINSTNYCRPCGHEHGADDVRVELVFEILKDHISDAAA